MTDAEPPRRVTPRLVGGAVALVVVIVGVAVAVNRDSGTDTNVSTVTTAQAAPARPDVSVELASTFFPLKAEADKLRLNLATPLPVITADAHAAPVSEQHQRAFAANGVEAELDQVLVPPGVDPARPDQAPAGRPASLHVIVDVFKTAAGAAATRTYSIEQLRASGYQSLKRRAGSGEVALQMTFQGVSTTQGFANPGNNVVLRVVGECNQCFPGQAPDGFDELLAAARQKLQAQHTPEEVAKIELDFDTARVVDLWVAWGEAWKQGTDAGLAYIQANDYPGLPATPDFCRHYFGVTGPGFRVESSVRLESITAQPDWTIPAGRLQRTKPDGRVYVMTVDQYDTARTRTSIQAHVTVLKGRALFFFDCTL